MASVSSAEAGLCLAGVCPLFANRRLAASHVQYTHPVNLQSLLCCVVLQVVQLFDSWAHHLSPDQFAEFSLPYAERIITAVRAKYPHVPLIFHGNGGTGKLGVMRHSSADVLGLDWACTMAEARHALGRDRTLQVRGAGCGPGAGPAAVAGRQVGAGRQLGMAGHGPAAFQMLCSSMVPVAAGQGPVGQLLSQGGLQPALELL